MTKPFAWSTEIAAAQNIQPAWELAMLKSVPKRMMQVKPIACPFLFPCPFLSRERPLRQLQNNIKK